MEFCVLVKISKHKISFWYQSGTSSYAPLIIKDSNEVPLFFYVDGNDFIFGDDLALERFNSNDPNAFGNYFDIIKDPSKYFIISGNKKPVKQLLYHGIEKYLNFFINEVLYKNDSLESYRQNFPLRFWFESDLEDKEKSLIENIFSEAGYDNIERIDYNVCLFQSLIAHGVLNANYSALLLNGINNTLFIELFKKLSGTPNGVSKLDGLGADPSVKILAEMILEDILAQESYLHVNRETEVAALLSYSAERLENITPIIKGYSMLTDGKKHYFEVKQRILNERLLYYSNDSIMYAAINDLLSSNSIDHKNISILLGSKEINTPYLINKLLVKYPNVKGVEKNHCDDALKLVFNKIADSNFKNKKYQPSIPPIPTKKTNSEENIKEIKKPLLPDSPIKINTLNFPPILPPRKDIKIIIPTIEKPKLPDFKKENNKNINPVRLPPLPPKKNNI
jgi:hypothetical protein